MQKKLPGLLLTRLGVGTVQLLPHSSQSQTKSQGQPHFERRTERRQLTLGGVTIINLPQKCDLFPCRYWCSQFLLQLFPPCLITGFTYRICLRQKACQWLGPSSFRSQWHSQSQLRTSYGFQPPCCSSSRLCCQSHKGINRQIEPLHVPPHAGSVG